MIPNATYSTREAARKLGITGVALGRYVKKGKVQPPVHTAKAGVRTIQMWTEEDIERVRKLLPKIANGRKTRYQKRHSAVSSQRAAKPKTGPKKSKRGKD